MGCDTYNLLFKKLLFRSYGYIMGMTLVWMISVLLVEVLSLSVIRKSLNRLVREKDTSNRQSRRHKLRKSLNFNVYKRNYLFLCGNIN